MTVQRAVAGYPQAGDGGFIPASAQGGGETDLGQTTSGGDASNPRMQVIVRRLEPRIPASGALGRAKPASADNWNTATRRKLLARDSADDILSHSGMLPTHDAALLRAVYHDGRPITEIAELLDVPIRRVRLRVRRLVDRIKSPHFDFVVRRSSAWPDLRRRVAHAVIVLGDSYRKAGRRLNLSLHTVRREYAVVLAMAEATTQIAAEVHGLREPRRA